jgi:hypothetical protein
MGQNRPIDKSSGFHISPIILCRLTGSDQLNESVTGFAIIS